MRRLRAPSGTRYSKRRVVSKPSGSSSMFRRRFTSRLSRGMFFRPQNYYFRRNFNCADIPLNSSGVGGALSFSLNQLPNVTEFTQLFDQYRINKVVLKFLPVINQINVDANSNNMIVPFFYTVIDYDDGSAPTSGADLQQYASCKVVSANKPFTRVVIPRTSTPVYRSGVSAAYLSNNARQWIDCNYVDVPHYGVKYWGNPTYANNQIGYRVEGIMYIAFKNVR